MKSLSSIQIVLSLCILFFLPACFKIDGEIIVEEPGANLEEGQVSISVTLPDGVPFRTRDLGLASLTNDILPIINGRATVEFFNEGSLELVVALNSEGNIVLLGHLDPTQKTFVLNSRSTAIALVLLSSWSIDLSEHAKREAWERIPILQGFEALVEAVEESLVTGELNPLVSTKVINEIDNFVKLNFRNPPGDECPITIDIRNGGVNLSNEKSSANYAFGLYNANNELMETRLLMGQLKVYPTLNDYFNQDYRPAGNFYTESIPVGSLSTGEYTLRFNNGLSVDDSEEYLLAQKSNLVKGLALALNAISPQFGKYMAELPDACIQQIIDLILLPQAAVLANFSENQDKNVLIQGTWQVIQATQFALINIIQECDHPFGDALKTNAILSLLDLCYYLSKVEVNQDALLFFDDFLNYKSSFDTCFAKKDGILDVCYDPCTALCFTTWEVFEATVTAPEDMWGFEGTCNLFQPCNYLETASCNNGNSLNFIRKSYMLTSLELAFKSDFTGNLNQQKQLTNQFMLNPETCSLEQQDNEDITEMLPFNWQPSPGGQFQLIVDERGERIYYIEIVSEEQLKLTYAETDGSANYTYFLRPKL